ncbi:MAG TPA: TIGR02391 family protein [Candidatus Tumulicola sp.]|jgi:uncharacterized protein (TIGR02391 family)
MWLQTAFPSLNILHEAAIDDVAFVVLEQAKTRGRNFSAVSMVCEIGDRASYPTTSRPPGNDLDPAMAIVSEAFSRLENTGLIARDHSSHNAETYRVTRRGLAIRGRSDFASYAKRSYLPDEVLREEIAEVALSPFLAGRYDEAVRSAFTRVESAVRKAAGYGYDQYGVKMMQCAFGSNKEGTELGPLSDPDMEPSERVSLMNLFAGAIGYIKNPLSHRELDIDDARIAASRILLANDLMYSLAANAKKALGLELAQFLKRFDEEMGNQ